jgi:hypothetical protein
MCVHRASMDVDNRHSLDLIILYSGQYCIFPVQNKYPKIFYRVNFVAILLVPRNLSIRPCKSLVTSTIDRFPFIYSIS